MHLGSEALPQVHWQEWGRIRCGVLRSDVCQGFEQSLTSPVEEKSCALSRSKSSRDGKVSPLHLSYAVETKTSALLAHSWHTFPNLRTSRITGPISRPTWVGVWWRTSTYMCLSLFCCLRRCCLSWQMELIESKACHWWDYWFHQKKKRLKCQGREEEYV